MDNHDMTNDTTETTLPNESAETPWTTIDFARPMAHAREVAGLTLMRASLVLDLGGSTIRRIESRKASSEPKTIPLLMRLLKWCLAFGLDVEVRVRPTNLTRHLRATVGAAGELQASANGDAATLAS
jgi:hypothetical protein